MKRGSLEHPERGIALLLALVVLLLVNSLLEVVVVPVVRVKQDNTHQVHHHGLLDKQDMVDWESE